ncbi:MAG: hypothetical protein RL418_32 [Actinomycetota bacterium]
MLTSRLHMLGVGGGPRLHLERSRPGIALEVGNSVYLFDVGYETVLQYQKAGLQFSSLQAVFITHRHFDHTSGLIPLMLHGWTAKPRGVQDNIAIYGPQNMAQSVALMLDSFRTEIDNFERGGGFGSFPSYRGIDIKPNPGITLVYQDDLVEVHTTEVFHGAELSQALAYRVKIISSGKVIVFSGDVGEGDSNLGELASNCDYLVHEAQLNEDVEKLVASFPEGQKQDLRNHMLSSHTDVGGLPKFAKRHQIKNIVFCHYTPFPGPVERYRLWAEQNREDFGGGIFAPNDLDVLEIS